MYVSLRFLLVLSYDLRYNLVSEQEMRKEISLIRMKKEYEE